MSEQRIEQVPDLPGTPVPVFGGTLADDAALVAAHLAETGQRLLRANADPHAAAAVRAQRRKVLEAFLRAHAVAMYDELTEGRTRFLRVSDLCYAAAARYPGILPTREDIAGERALNRQSAKQGLEVDQGLFAAHVLADRACGLHLVKAMLRPKPQSLELLDAFRESGFVDLGRATLERRGNIGYVTLDNPDYLNSEDDEGAAALETAVDLVLLDDCIEAGVLRGSRMEHGKYAGRRVFNAGINLTHLYFGQISYIDFLVEREIGLLSKIKRGLWTDESWSEDLEDYLEKPWLAVVEAFAIGGGCQILCVVDRVIAEPDAYINLPASKEGFMPGAANLRFPYLVGIQQARQAIFFEKPFRADTPEGRMICDEVVAPEEMDAAVDRNAAGLLTAGFTSAVSNRKGLRVSQESLSQYRRYMATYARQQVLCVYDPALIANLERNWRPHERRR